MHARARALFVSFEGSEGCGKSTQLEVLAQTLTSQGRSVVVTREPGGTPIGEAIRHLLKFSPESAQLTPEAELLLFAASRAQLVRHVIAPALAAGTVVLCDRFHDSTSIYQGAGRGLAPGLVQSVTELATGGLQPDLTLLLDMDADAARLRALRRPRPVSDAPDRLESEPAEFYRAIREGYLALARREPDRIKVIDAAQPRQAVADAIWSHVSHVLDA